MKNLNDISDDEDNVDVKIYSRHWLAFYFFAGFFLYPCFTLLLIEGHLEKYV